MNEGSESSAVLTAEQELLIEGCKSYLDVMHATNAFQVRVCNAARDVIGAARAQISKIAQLDEPLEVLANAFVDPAGADNNFDGSEAWVGAYMWLDRPVYATLYLALVFYRDPNNDPQTPDICFALEVYTRRRIRQYGNIFREHLDCEVCDDDGNWLAVELRRPLENPLSIREELTTILDNALTWWNNSSNNATTNGESA